MALKRLTLPDGQWADLLEKPRHEDYAAIVAAAESVFAGDMADSEFNLVVGRRYCKAWHVLTDDGWHDDVTDWAPADPDVTDAIVTEALNRWDEWQDQRVPLVERRRRTTRRTPSTPSDDGSAGTPSSSETPS